MSEQKPAVAEHENVIEASADETLIVPVGGDEVAEQAADAPEAMAEVETTPLVAVAEETVADDAVAEEAVAEETVIEQAVAEQAVLQQAVVEEAAESVVAAEMPSDEAEVVAAPAQVEPMAMDAPEPVVELAVEPSAEALSEPESMAEVTAEASGSNGVEGDGVEGDDDEKRVVRVLSVGQPVMGTVRRITDFGAFVDIGVGRDGLIHISELSARRVGKVSDVLVEGQEVQTWIKKLDRERNRISLTLIDPGTKTIRDLAKGDLVNGTVSRMMPYGAFVDIGIGRDALLHVREMGERYIAKPEDVVKVGEVIEARVIEVSRRRGRVDLSIKGLREEPEPEVMAEPMSDRSGSGRSASEQTAPESAVQSQEAADKFAEVEVLTPMELAFKRAMEAEGMELDASARKQSKRNSRDQSRMLQEEIIARTLSTPRK